MVEKFNIIDLDTKIKNYFRDEINQLGKLEDELKELIVTRERLVGKTHDNVIKTLDTNIENKKQRISLIREERTLSIYLSKTSSCIEEFRVILNTSEKINFFKRNVESKSDKKIAVIKKYIDNIRYLNLDDNELMAEIKESRLLVDQQEEKKEKCDECSNDSFDETERYRICKSCGSQEEIIAYASSYKDADRVNISNKYIYDREIHFRDCMNQYQGKQNCNIEKKVYDDLEREFKNHGLLLEGNTKEERFANITRIHVSAFLHELGYSKHYENVILIHYNMTGKPPDNIKHLEDVLRDEFNLLVETYNKLYANNARKKFISTHLTLYQLLLKHRHPCNKEDFIMLKSTECKAAHFDTLRILFDELGFEFYNS